MAGKKKPFSDSQDNVLVGQDPMQGSGDTRKTGTGARKPGEMRGSGDDR